MCIDQSNWRFKAYDKHRTPAPYRDKPRAEIDRITLNSDSRYYPDLSPDVLEQQVVATGTYVESHTPHKVIKIQEFDQDVGASNGQPSKWVKIEATNGEYHGRPITREQFDRWSDKRIPCCR